MTNQLIPRSCCPETDEVTVPAFDIAPMLLVGKVQPRTAMVNEVYKPRGNYNENYRWFITMNTFNKFHFKAEFSNHLRI